MDSKDATPNNTGFYIWFNKKEKKEYFSTPMTLNKIRLNKNKAAGFLHIKQPKTNSTKSILKENDFQQVLNTVEVVLLDINNPYEEKYGMFIINFLNARFENYILAHKDFFQLYGIEILDKNSQIIKTAYKDEDDFKEHSRLLFDASQKELLELQKQFRNCVDYMYNLNGIEDDKEFNSYVKFKAYSLKNDMEKYSENIKMVMNSAKTLNKDYGDLNLNELTKNIHTGKINLHEGPKYTSNLISNICYIALDDIASSSMPIKVCKHCGRYFIPVNRNAEVYCDLPPIKRNTKKCRELGARTTYNHRIQNVEGLLLYRRTYQKKLMEIIRDSGATPEDRESFDKWKKSAQAKIKEFKSKKITEEELNKWMKENT